MEKHDIVIVGAGPAGLSAAKDLAMKDKDVLVLDREPEDRIGDKVCTAGVSPYMVEKMHLPESVYIGTKVPTKVCINDVEYSGELIGYKTTGFVDRIKMGQYQVKEAKRFGAEVRGQSLVSKIDRKNNRVVLDDRKEIEYNKLIASFGANSRLLKTMGFKPTVGVGYQYLLPDERCRDFTIYFDFDRIGGYYMWKNPHGDGKNRTDILEIGDAYFTDRRIKWENQKRGGARKQEFEKFFEERGIDLKGEHIIKKSAPAVVSWHGFKHGNVYLVGDTASFLNILAGHGIYPAIMSGRVAAKAILGEPYKEELKEVYRHHQVGSSWLFGLGLSEGKLNPKYLAKIWRWLEDHYYGHRVLTKTNEIAAKLMKYNPGLCAFLYMSLLNAPTTLSAIETTERFFRMYWDGEIV